MPRPAGGTPTTVPARPWLGGPPRPGGAPGGPGGMGGPAGGAPGGRGGPAEGCWFMSMVPLNFGAAAPFRLKPHFVHVDAVSEFCVPQLGQNTHHLRQGARGPCGLHASRIGAERNGTRAWFSSRRRRKTAQGRRLGVRDRARRRIAASRGRALGRRSADTQAPSGGGGRQNRGGRACRAPRPSYRPRAPRRAGRRIDIPDPDELCAARLDITRRRSLACPRFGSGSVRTATERSLRLRYASLGWRRGRGPGWGHRPRPRDAPPSSTTTQGQPTERVGKAKPESASRRAAARGKGASRPCQQPT